MRRINGIVKTAAVLGIVGLALQASAAVVAEWRLDGATDVASGGDVALDVARTSASTQSTLLNATNYKASATGLSSAWKPFLQSGYVALPYTSGTTPGGLETKDTDPGANSNAEYRDYLGFSRFGANAGDGLTFAAVIKRDAFLSGINDVWGKYRHFVFSPVTLTYSGGDANLWFADDSTWNDTKAVKLTFTTGNSGTKSVQASFLMDKSKWYFVAASVAANEQPILYVREMNPSNPGASAAATAAIGIDVANNTTFPDSHALLLGARRTSTSTSEMLGGNIAWAQVQNTYFSEANNYAAFDALYTSLSVPEPAGLAMLGLLAAGGLLRRRAR